MRLLFELLGVLCLAAMVRAVLIAGPSRGRGSPRAWLTAVAIVIGGFAFWSGVWPTARDLVRQHSRDARLTVEQALALPGTALPSTSSPAREDVLAQAQWILFYEASHQSVPSASVDVFAPGYAIARTLR